MKITKRIMAVLILIALLVSCVLLSVSAEESEKTFKADGISDVEDILEYYSAKDFVADNYESEAPSSVYYTGDKSERVSDPKNANNQVLKVTAGNNAYTVDADTKALVVSFDIYYDATMQGEYRINAKSLGIDGVESVTYTTFFSVNGKTNKFRYSLWDAELNNGDGGFTVTDFEAIAPAADAWYKVVLFFDTESGYYSFKIVCTDNEGNPIEVDSEKFSLGSVTALTDVSLKTAVAKRGDKVSVHLDNVEIYEGTFERNPANKEYVTSRTFLDLEALFNKAGTDLQTQVRIAKVFYELCLSEKYQPVLGPNENLGISGNDLAELQTNIPKYINTAFAKEVIRMANAINSDSSYSSKLENIKEYDFYDDILPANEGLLAAPGFDTALAYELIAARADIENEITLCTVIEEDSEKLLALMFSYDSSNANYDGYMKGLYAEISACTKWDVTYPGCIGTDASFTMQDAADLRESFLAKYNKLDAAASEFIDLATKMKNALLLFRDAESKMNAAYEIMKGIDPEDENLSEEDRELYAEQSAIYEAEKAKYEEEFAILANSYIAAKEIYNGGDIDENLDEATHTELFSLFDVYTGNEDFIIRETAKSDKFIETVKNVELATYYTSKVERLAEAESYIEFIRPKYGAVEAALKRYYELKDAIAAQEKAATDYIAAVTEIGNAEDYAERKAAVEAATLLKAEGDVLGISGVNEANMALAEAAARIETEAVNSAALIALASEIGSVRDFLTRRELIAKAQYAADNTDETIEGVAEAKELLASLIEAYVADVNKMNAAHALSSEKAAELMGSAVSYENVYKAASIIKAFVK